jgi:hypothetical protein
MKNRLPRARIGRRAVLVGAAGVAGALLPVVTACGKALPIACSSEDGLSDGEKAERAAMAYVDVASDRTRMCESCQQWLPPAESAHCGACKVMKGPIHPRGSCKVFSPAS